MHVEFARAVRDLNLPGVSVEQSFDIDGFVNYGFDGSIRTDVILRDENGRIVAIYDVKTGDATMSRPRGAKIRAYTGAGPDVPIIIMHALKGNWRR